MTSKIAAFVCVILAMTATSAIASPMDWTVSLHLQGVMTSCAGGEIGWCENHLAMSLSSYLPSRPNGFESVFVFDPDSLPPAVLGPGSYYWYNPGEPGEGSLQISPTWPVIPTMGFCSFF